MFANTFANLFTYTFVSSPIILEDFVNRLENARIN